jgi:hypothetical protein
MREKKSLKAPNQALKFGVVALGFLAALGISSGAANAVPGDNVGTAGGEQVVELSATVDVLAPCVWVLSGVEPTLALATTNAAIFDITDEDYVGDALSLSATDTIDIFLSGDSATENTVCGVYVSGDAGIRLSVSATNLAFIGPLPDDSMNFTMDADNPLEVDASSTIGCWGDWTDEGAKEIGATITPVEPYSILGSDVESMDTEGQTVMGGEFPSCELDVTYSTDVPAGKVPASSSDYSLTGPELLVTIVNGTP